MDKRFHLGIGLSVFLILLCLGAKYGTALLFTPMEQALGKAGDLALEESWDRALPLARQAHDRWRACRKAAAVLADQTPMDEMDGLFAEISVFGRVRDGEHFAACCHRLRLLCRAMQDAHAGSWWNFL